MTAPFHTVPRQADGRTLAVIVPLAVARRIHVRLTNYTRERGGVLANRSPIVLGTPSNRLVHGL